MIWSYQSGTRICPLNYYARLSQGKLLQKNKHINNYINIHSNFSYKDLKKCIFEEKYHWQKIVFRRMAINQHHMESLRFREHIFWNDGLNNGLKFPFLLFLFGYGSFSQHCLNLLASLEFLLFQNLLVVKRHLRVTLRLPNYLLN